MNTYFIAKEISAIRRTCAMLIVNCGITRVMVCGFRYHSGQESEAMFADAAILLDYANVEELRYERQ